MSLWLGLAIDLNPFFESTILNFADFKIFQSA